MGKGKGLKQVWNKKEFYREEDGGQDQTAPAWDQKCCSGNDLGNLDANKTVIRFVFPKSLTPIILGPAPEFRNSEQGGKTKNTNGETEKFFEWQKQTSQHRSRHFG